MSPKNLQVRHRPGIFFIRFGRGETAFLKYTEEKGEISIDSTYTPHQFRGKGVARTLMLSAIEFARRRGLKIVPACSYAVEFFEKNREYEDLLHSE